MNRNPEFPVWVVGRRKTSVARVRVVPGAGKMEVNGKTLPAYFAAVKSGGKAGDGPEPSHFRYIHRAQEPLAVVPNVLSAYDVFITASGGGLTGQSDAIRLGLARAIFQLQPDSKPVLRKAGLLTRDPRAVERKKYGRPKARKRFQYSKR